MLFPIRLPGRPVGEELVGTSTSTNISMVVLVPLCSILDPLCLLGTGDVEAESPEVVATLLSYGGTSPQSPDEWATLDRPCGPSRFGPESGELPARHLLTPADPQPRPSKCRHPKGYLGFRLIRFRIPSGNFVRAPAPGRHDPGVYPHHGGQPLQRRLMNGPRSLLDLSTSNSSPSSANTAGVTRPGLGAAHRRDQERPVH